MHRQSYNVQATLTGGRRKAKARAEKANKLVF